MGMEVNELYHIVTLAYIKNEGKWKAYLVVRKWPADNKLEIFPIENQLCFVLQERYCIGYATLIPRYYYEPCKEKVKGVRQCDSCSKLDRISVCGKCTGKMCKFPELKRYCEQEHYIYLAAFSPKNIKVGIATLETFENRIVEQGALAVRKIAYAENRNEAIRLEKAIRLELGITDRVPTSEKERLLASGINIQAIENSLENYVKKLYQTKNSFIKLRLFPKVEKFKMSNYYDLSTLNNKLTSFIYKKGETVCGNVKTNIGLCSILQKGDSLAILNLKKLEGWVVKVTKEKNSTHIEYFL